MKMNRLPPIEELRRLFDYDPATGVVRRRVSNTNRVKAGSIVGCRSNGYLVVEVRGRLFGLHRICWAIYHGRDPHPMQIDHINHKRDDNRIANLRRVTHHQNKKNNSMQANNTSGHTGVYWNKHNQKWIAYIKIHGKKKHIGCFSDKSDAIAARKAAEVELGFHKNHGHRHEAPRELPVDFGRQLALHLMQNQKALETTEECNA